jgi:hypothetical protein
MVFPGNKMIDIFMEATDFHNIFEKDVVPENIKKLEELNGGDSEMVSAAKNAQNNEVPKYWEQVFANATTDAHKLFKS